MYVNVPYKMSDKYMDCADAHWAFCIHAHMY